MIYKANYNALLKENEELKQANLFLRKQLVIIKNLFHERTVAIPIKEIMNQAKPTTSDSVVTLPCTSSNSIEQLLKAIADFDFKAITHEIGGIEHRASKYENEEDFFTEGTYEEDARYVYPAREKLIRKCASHILSLLTNQSK